MVGSRRQPWSGCGAARLRSRCRRVARPRRRGVAVATTGSCALGRARARGERGVGSTRQQGRPRARARLVGHCACATSRVRHSVKRRGHDGDRAAIGRSRRGDGDTEGLSLEVAMVCAWRVVARPRRDRSGGGLERRLGRRECARGRVKAPWCAWVARARAHTDLGFRPAERQRDG